MARCLKVPVLDGEGVRRALIEAGLLDVEHAIRSEDGYLYIPCLVDSFDGYDAVEADLKPLRRKVTDYKELVDVPKTLWPQLPHSYDVIGDVAVIKLVDELMPFRRDIAEAMLKVSPSLRAVFLDSGVHGEFRVRGLDRIAGTGTSETIHKESGVRLATDPSKVYFNPRLATERYRVAGLVEDGETVIDMFAGVAPFGAVICRHADPEVVYSIDLNPDCEAFARRNAEMNGADNLVAITGDATEVVRTLPKADRIIMNLPQMADRFLGDALGALKPGGTVHMHRILERSELETFKSELGDRMASEGHSIEFSRVSEMKTYSPTMSVYVFDISSSASE